MNDFIASVPTNVKLGVGGGLAIFLLGSCLGAATTTPEVDFVEVPVTKTVVEPAPDPITEYVLPSDCSAALRTSERIGAAANRLFNRGEEQLSLISQARQALAERGDLSAVENEQRNLRGKAIGDLSKLSEQQYAYDVYFESCQEAMQ